MQDKVGIIAISTVNLKKSQVSVTTHSVPIIKLIAAARRHREEMTYQQKKILVRTFDAES